MTKVQFMILASVSLVCLVMGIILSIVGTRDSSSTWLVASIIISAIMVSKTGD